MKLYDSIGPNPKLVRMFAAEKNFAFAETETLDLMAGANRQPPYVTKNPAGQLPAVELDDGALVAETIAICELLEELAPEPPLIGATPAARAETRMWVRRVEWRVVEPMTAGFRSVEGRKMFAKRMLVDEQAGVFRKAEAQAGLTWLDAQLPGRTTIVPGRFTLADVTLFAFVEFGAQVGQPLAAEHKNLTAWFEATRTRASAKA